MSYSRVEHRRYMTLIELLQLPVPISSPSKWQFAGPEWGLLFCLKKKKKQPMLLIPGCHGYDWHFGKHNLKEKNKKKVHYYNQVTLPSKA